MVFFAIFGSDISQNYSFSFFGVHNLRNIVEEIVIQQFGDANQHGEVDAFPLEHLVNNTVVAVDGLREPPHRAKRIVNFILLVTEVLDYLISK